MMIDRTFGASVRELRRRRRLSLSALAREVGCSEEWLRSVEAGEDLTVRQAERLAAVLGTDAATLFAAGDESEEPDPERLTLTLRRACRVDRRLVEELCTEAERLPGLRGRMPPNSLGASADAYLLAIRRLLHTPAPSGLRRQLESAAAETAVVAGHVYRVLGRSERSAEYWQLATRLANDAGDSGLEALAMTFASELCSPIYPDAVRKDTDRTRALLSGAERLARGADAARARALVRQAEESGFRRDALTAFRLLDEADAVLSAGLAGLDGIYAAFWGRNLHVAFRGKTAMLAGEPGRAIPLLEVALTDESAAPMADRLNMTADLGAAYAQRGQIDHAATLLTQALSTAMDAGLVSCIGRIVHIRNRELNEHVLDPAVRSLDQRLGTVSARGDR